MDNPVHKECTYGIIAGWMILSILGLRDIKSSKYRDKG